MHSSSIESGDWRIFRMIYYCALFSLFASIGLFFGPNLILFRKMTRLAPEDFSTIVQRECAPIVRAMKAYERDHDHLPDRFEELVPFYLPDRYSDLQGSVSDGQFCYYTLYHHRITYDFTAGREGWRVSGPYANGPIPLSPETAWPLTRPATQPR